MGINFSQITKAQPVLLSKIKGKKVAVSTYTEMMHILQSAQAQKTPHAHVKGLFDRAMALVQAQVKPVFVFSGTFPEIRRHQRITNDVPPPRVTNLITREMVDDIKLLLTLMGFPIVQAPSEDEAQSAHLCQKDEVWAVISEGSDSLLYGSPRAVLGLTTSKPKKGKKDTQFPGAQLLEASDLQTELGIDADQLLVLGMILGTRFNPAIVGISPKHAVELVRKWKDFGKLFKYAGWNYAYTWKEVYDCIKTLPVTNKYKLKWNPPRTDHLTEFLLSKGMSKKKIEENLELLK